MIVSEVEKSVSFFEKVAKFHDSMANMNDKEFG
jgi:hypothetical protein